MGEIINGVYIPSNEDLLQHYGKKGMKWKKRKGLPLADTVRDAIDEAEYRSAVKDNNAQENNIQRDIHTLRDKMQKALNSAKSGVRNGKAVNPKEQPAVDAYNKALKDVEDAKKVLADATTDRDVATEKYNAAMAELKESKFRYDRALADYNRLKPVEVKAKKYHASKKNAKRITKSKSPKTGDETALLANMGILALAGYAAAKTNKKRKNNK